MNNLKYLWYILKHKFWVAYVGIRWTGAPFWLLVIHDFSKLSKEERAPYRECFTFRNPSKTRLRSKPRPISTNGAIRIIGSSGPAATRIVAVAAHLDSCLSAISVKWWPTVRAQGGLSRGSGKSPTFTNAIKTRCNSTLTPGVGLRNFWKGYRDSHVSTHSHNYRRG